MKRDEFLQVLRSPFHFATCDAVLRGCKIVNISKPLQWRRLSKKVRSPLGSLCETDSPRIGGVCLAEGGFSTVCAAAAAGHIATGDVKV